MNLNDLGKAAKQTIQNAAQFLRRYPSPASYVQSRATETVRGTQDFLTKFPSPASYVRAAVPQQAGNITQRIQTQPIIPFLSQTSLSHLGNAARFAGQQLQRVNISELNVPQPYKSGIPALQLPEQINSLAQSYGRTLASPFANPLETALNVLPVAGFAKTKSIQEALRGQLSVTRTPEEASLIFNEFSKNIIKKGGRDDLQALRATLNKELTNLVGGTGDYKKDYAIIQMMKDDASVGSIVRTILNKVSDIDETLSKQTSRIEKIVSPEKREMAEKVASQFLNPMRGLGRDVARKGYTALEVSRMKPKEAVNILAERELAEIIKSTPVSQKVNILDYFRTPEHVLSKIGLGNEAKRLRSSYEAYQAQLPKEIDKIRQWAKRVPGEDSNEKIFRFLDGEKGVTFSPEEGKVAEEIRLYLNDWANKLKLPLHKRVTDYITRIYKLGTVDAEFDDDLAKIIDPTIAKSVYNPFLEKRIGSRIDYLRDTWQALQAYVKRATRKVNLDPALEQLSEKAPSLELSQWNFVKRLVDRVNMRPTEADNLIDNLIKSVPGIGYIFGQRPTTFLTRRVRQAVYRGTLGLNVSSALRNLTQGVNTLAELGERWTFTGYVKMFRNWGSDELQRVGVLRDSFVQDQTLTVFQKATEGIDKVLFSLFEAAEKINRGAAYYGSKARSLSMGLNEEQAIEAAKELVRKTQFTFGSIDTPLALSSDLAKTIGQLQTFNLKQLEYLLGKTVNRELGGLIRWIGSMLVLKKVLYDEFGMKLDVLPVSFGLTPSLQAGQAAGQMMFGGDEGRQDGLKGLGRASAAFFPGGVQLRKSFEGLRSYQRGESMTPSGLMRFPVDQTAPNLFRSALFGQYSLPDARQYFDQNTRPLSERQSQAVRGSDEKTKAYQGIISKREENRQTDQVREQVKKTGTGSFAGQLYVFIDPQTGSVKTIDTSFQPVRPTYTGIAILDKELRTEYLSDLTKRKGIITAMFEQGLLTKDAAEKHLQDIAVLRSREVIRIKKAPKVRKVRTIRIRAPKYPKIRISKRRMKTIRIRRPPRIKAANIKKNIFARSRQPAFYRLFEEVNS